MNRANRSFYGGGPQRGLPGMYPPSSLAGYGPQDTRNNLAVQPAANSPGISLKKAAVKVIRPAGASPMSPPATSSAAPVKSASKVEDRHEPTKSKLKADVPEFSPRLKASLAPNNEAESALAEMFARLNSRSTAVTIIATPDSRPEVGLDKSAFKFENFSSLNVDTPTSVPQIDLKSSNGNLPHDTTASKSAAATPTTPVSPKETPVLEAQKPSPVEKADKMVAQETGKQKMDVEKEDTSDDSPERKYLKQALAYLIALPTDGKVVTTDLVKKVATKLHKSQASEVQLPSNEVEDQKLQYLRAVTDYVNGLGKRPTPITPNFVEKILTQCEGNFLHLCALLVVQKLLAIDNLKDVVGLCEVIIKAIPEMKAEITNTDSDRGWKDPMDRMTAWPFQQKRETIPKCRTCMLSGVEGITSINQLQALVWGGRVEFMALPAPGSKWALVRFLTPEACQTYLDATQNGIELPGNKKTIVFVQPTEGPNSINDVLRSCIDNGETRCVRATDVEEDWGDGFLLNLARGTGAQKREVDRIKRGKTAKGRRYIEFRFANILHALSFRRVLRQDDDWEPCQITYAPDPCETARGVHFKDEDEELKDNGLST